MSNTTQHYDVAIIGGGAAGLMCAAAAAERGRRVVVIDHANKVGKKILMSGGGRCNFTNYTIEPDNYLSANPHFCKSALSRYTQWDFIALVDKYGLKYHEKKLGQLFCDNKAQDILDILLNECERTGVDIQTSRCLDQVEKTQNERFQLNTSRVVDKKNKGMRGDDKVSIEVSSLVVASGGLSIPTMGASSKGYDIAKQFGLTMTDTCASLVPFVLTDMWRELATSLSGLAIDVSVSAGGQSFNEALLFTHRGLSGPAILQISNYWQAGSGVKIDFLPHAPFNEKLADWKEEKRKSSLANLLSEYLPKRFVIAWLDMLKDVDVEKNIFDFSDKDIALLCQHFHQWVLVPAGTEGYRTAEVTRGGIHTDGVSSKTFESLDVKGLYFIGEVLDVTGWLGGYNFQWAWSSGWCAGQYV